MSFLTNSFLSQLLPMGLTWDPTKTGSNITLSVGDTVATRSVGGNTSVLAISGKSSGKWFFQGLFGGSAFATTSIGIGLSTADLSSYAGGSAGSIGWLSGDTKVRNNSVVQATYGSWGSGDTIGVAVDFSVNKIWFSKNGIWNGDPVTNTGGVSISAGTYFPHAGLDGPSNCTIQAGTPPSGFTSWT